MRGRNTYDSRKRINPQRNTSHIPWAGAQRPDDIAYQGVMDLMAYILKKTMKDYVYARSTEHETKENKREEIEKDIRTGVIAKYLAMKDIREEDFITLCRKRAGIA